MQQFRTKAIILRRTNYGEADRIITALTPQHGKISIMARGIRRPKSKLAGGLELFSICDITVMAAKGDMYIVTSSRLQQFFDNILRDYNRMQCGYMAVSFSNKATHTVAEPEFYELLSNMFMWLQDISIDWRLCELSFKLRLMQLLGHGLNVATDAAGQKLVADMSYEYNYTNSAFVPNLKGVFTSSHIKLLRLAGVKTPPVLQKVAGIQHIIDDCLALVRSAEM